jgi:hypothetical protein
MKRGETMLRYWYRGIGAVFTGKAGVVSAVVASMALGLSLTAWAALPGTLLGNPDPANIDDSDPYFFIVYPTGVWSLTSGDVVNVQWAVDNVASGGTVLLKATNTAGQPTVFNFGTVTFSYITLSNSLTLQGEALARDAQGGWITSGSTIRGGTQMQVGGGGTTPAPSVIIRDIIFDRFRAGAIRVKALQGYNEISGCRFQNFISGPSVGGSAAGAFPIVVHGGVELVDIENLRGTLKVLDNFFGRPVNLDGSPANLINNVMHFSNCHLNLEISGNTIEDCTWGGFMVMGNKGHTVIARNIINKTRSFAYQGIAIGIGLYPTNSLFVSKYTYDGSSEITDNIVTIGAPQDALSTTNSFGILIGKYPPTQTFPGFPGISPMPVPADVRHVVSGNKITMYRNSVTNAVNPAAIGCLGDVSATRWTDNTVEGEAARGIRLSRTLLSFLYPANSDAFVTENAFDSNNLTGFVAAEFQVFLDQSCNTNEFRNNDYGPAGEAGTYVLGSNNTFVNEDFWGPYPGFLNTDRSPLDPRLPCMWFASGAVGNGVSALKDGQALQGFDLCTKIYLEGAPGQNRVKGYEKCGAVPESVIVAMVQRELEFRQRDCESSGGVWSGDTCACPAGYTLNLATGECEAPPVAEVMESMGFVWNESAQRWE